MKLLHFIQKMKKNTLKDGLDEKNEERRDANHRVLLQCMKEDFEIVREYNYTWHYCNCHPNKRWQPLHGGANILLYWKSHTMSDTKTVITKKHTHIGDV